MDRRDALKALGSVAAGAGLTVTPVTTKDAERVSLIVMKLQGRLSDAMRQNLRSSWRLAVAGTDLEHVKMVVLEDGMDLEFVRG